MWAFFQRECMGCPRFFFDDVIHSFFGSKREDSSDLGRLSLGFDVEDEMVRMDVLGNRVGAYRKFGAHFVIKCVIK